MSAPIFTTGNFNLSFFHQQCYNQGAEQRKEVTSLQDFEYDKEEFDDEDFAEVDALIEQMKSLPRNEVYILNPEAVRRISIASAIVKNGIRVEEESLNFVCKRDDLAPDIGFIEMETADIDFCHKQWFLRAFQYADDVEIYPLLNHKTRVTLGFRKILVPLRSE